PVTAISSRTRNCRTCSKRSYAAESERSAQPPHPTILACTHAPRTLGSRTTFVHTTRIMSSILTRFLTLLLVTVCSFAYASSPARVEISNGVLAGLVDSANGLRIFRGVPYAQPPVGELRWREPQPVKNWKGERKA